MWYIKLLIFSSVFAIICAAASEIEANDLKRSKRAGVVDLNYFLKGLFQKSAALSNAKLVVAKNVINQKFHAKPTTKATTTTTKKPTLKPIVFPPVALHPWFGGFGHYDYDFIKPWYNKAKFVTAAKGVGAGVGVRAGVGAGGPAGPGYINFDYDDYVEGNFPANAANVFRQPRLRTTSTTTTTQAPTTTTTTSTTTTSTTTAAPTTAAPTAAAPPALPPAASLTSRGGYFLPLNQLARFSSSNFNAPLNNAYYDDYGDYGPFVTPRSRAARPRLSNLNAIARATAAPSAAAATATTATPAMRAAPLRAPNARLNQNVLFQYAQRDGIIPQLVHNCLYVGFTRSLCRYLY